MGIELTEEIIKAGRLVYRKHGSTAMAILVGPLNAHQLGQSIDGLPVAASRAPLGDGDYQLYGVVVTQPWLACADLGME